MNSERIPEEILIKARLRLKRRVAAMLVQALAVTGDDPAVVEAKIGHEPGWMLAYINALIIGTTKDMDIISDICVALNIEMQFKISPYDYAVDTVAVTTSTEASL